MSTPVSSKIQWYALVHKHGCGEHAILADHKPCQGDPLIASGFYSIDGTPKMSGDPLKCDSCGEFMQANEFQAPWFEPVDTP